MSNSLNRVSVYRLSNYSTTTGIKLKNYDRAASDTKILGGTIFSYELYFLNSKPLPPDWFGVFKPLKLSLPNGEPQVQLSGFVMLVICGAEHYALTGGLGHIALRAQNEVEHQFGSILAQKILSVPELKGLVQKDTSGIVLRLDRVFRGLYNPQGETNNLRRILYSVRGSLGKKNKYLSEVGKSIQAGNALTVNGAKSFDQLFQFLGAISKLSKSKLNQMTIPQLEQIDKKANAHLWASLESELVTNLTNYSADGNVSLFIDGEESRYLPDVVTSYRLIYGNNQQVPVSTYQEVLEQAASILASKSNTSDRLDAYQKMRLHVLADDQTQQTRALSAFLCGDITWKGEAYFIDNDRWFRADSGFLKHIDQELDNIPCVAAGTLALLPWDIAKFKGTRGENKYNTACCEKSGHLLLDCRTVRVPNERGPIELCDILAEVSSIQHLIHVKKAKGAGLRELFAQGYVSADLYRDNTFRDLVHRCELNGADDMKPGEKKLLMSLKTRLKREFRVVFAIFDNTPSHKIPTGTMPTSKVFSGTFPPFAKVDLLDRVQAIRGMGYNDVMLVRIPAK